MTGITHHYSPRVRCCIHIHPSSLPATSAARLLLVFSHPKAITGPASRPPIIFHFLTAPVTSSLHMSLTPYGLPRGRRRQAGNPSDAGRICQCHAFSGCQHSPVSACVTSSRSCHGSRCPTSSCQRRSTSKTRVGLGM
ncbi:uncharacterized protein QC764_705570 [Podospora pseudoanserina]|uniref:Uncharacterized protein n=1 Tax=Podospora pseudoanserina TaxID=2609844 RepID=A0ABR0HJD8_9PEZI|nr:hypothetical protein QC764_705570 [Podospora pseudoanserina]